MLDKLAYYTPRDESGARLKVKGKELPVELHALTTIDAIHAVNSFPAEWSYELPEGVERKDVVDRRVKTPVFTDAGDDVPAGAPVAARAARGPSAKSGDID